jgi:hypothetical protein
VRCALCERKMQGGIAGRPPTTGAVPAPSRPVPRRSRLIRAP